MRIDAKNAYQRELREKQLCRLALVTSKNLEKIALWQAKTPALYVEYKNISINKTDFHEMCAIVNNPGGAVKVRLLPFVHECGLAGSVFDLIDGGLFYAQSQRHLIRIFGIDTHFAFLLVYCTY